MIWEELMSAAALEQYLEDENEAFDVFSSVFAANTERDLNRFRSEIATALKEEIILRFYPQDAVINWMIPEDAVLQKSIDLLSSGEANQILLGPTNP